MAIDRHAHHHWLRQRPAPLVLGIAGGSGSGKTSVAAALQASLTDDAVLLQHDVLLADGRGVLHTIDCVMCCLRLLQHCRYEQVWNKTVRPSPKVSIHGEWNHARDELHAILIHCDSWHPLMQGLRGHAIPLLPPMTPTCWNRTAR